MAFYVTIATAVGMLFNFLPIDPVRALYWAADLNGVVAVPVLALLMIMA